MSASQVQGHHLSAVPFWLPTNFPLLLESQHTQTKDSREVLSLAQALLFCFGVFFCYCVNDNRYEAGELYCSFSVFLSVLSEGQNVTSRSDHRAKIRPVNDQQHS